MEPKNLPRFSIRSVKLKPNHLLSDLYSQSIYTPDCYLILVNYYQTENYSPMKSRLPSMLCSLVAVFSIMGCSVTPDSQKGGRPVSLVASPEPEVASQDLNGKSLEQWIAKVQEPQNEQDLHLAFSALNLANLGEQRSIVLEFYVQSLKSDSLLTQEKAAFSLRAAGKPSHPDAADALVDALIHEVTKDEKRATDRASSVGDRIAVSLVQNITDALKIIGGPQHLPALKSLRDHKNSDFQGSLSQKLIVQAIVTLENRDNSTDTSPDEGS
ncbi:hypothetical protein [Acaryochloris marina]|uniref:Uncharacterized protein n=1 Tax=Acaryochloris marina (strain MBIC 11017) TaxID=329726 RepID=B0CA47_ACAM1|nr:hypothetical protein [Acaryochloris marina]ABW26634.1 conserved hypothetical protein [Acaryochloris marina MBIC11017]